MNYFPLYQSIDYSLALEYIEVLGRFNNVVLLHSSAPLIEQSRYSFIAIDPVKIWCVDDDQDQTVFNQLAKEISAFSLNAIPGLPPFQGGLAGFISYDIARNIEKLPKIAVKDIPYPQLMLGFYDVVISLDHLLKKAWIVSSGYPEKLPSIRIQKAKMRLAEIKKTLDRARINKVIIRKENNNALNITSNFSRKQYLEVVNNAKQAILNGDIFQVNLSQRFHCGITENLHPYDLFRSICKVNPAPFSAYMKWNELAIISSSPERFLKVSNQCVEARPIKGTIRRDKNPQRDSTLAKQLAESEKDRSENIMIVDLMRNDLSRVCLPHSVIVSQCCGIESYQNVHHLVSVVHGQLEGNENIASLLRATLPGGSITGAPKIRAMEIIDALEPTRRGPYCGNAIYIGFNGMMDSSILIRTYVLHQSRLTFQAGGAIVLDSSPLAEYEETLLKVKSLRQTLTAMR